MQADAGRDEQPDRRQVQRARAGERAALAEARRPRVQALLAVDLDVEERVEEVEAGDPGATAAPSAHACHGRSPVIATQAPTGASPSTAPSQRWQSQVNRFRYG